jgi:ribulose-phosphate 3-epimerase
MIAVDGGINQDTANLCKPQGANLLISGSYIFNGNYKENIDKLRR